MYFFFNYKNDGFLIFGPLLHMGNKVLWGEKIFLTVISVVHNLPKLDGF